MINLGKEKEWLLILFALNAVSILFHYVDNILRLKVYPDLPTTTVADIEMFWVVMIPFGIAGCLLYLRGKRDLAFYAFYLYCLLNLAVLGHYLRAPFSTISFEIHAFIIFETVTAVALAAYVARMHWLDHRI